MKKVVLGLVAILGFLAYQVFRPLSKAELYSVLDRSVVKIIVPDSFEHGGTGFGIRTASGHDYIVTNKHVCTATMDSQNEVRVMLHNNESRVIKRKVLRIHKTEDLCLIEGLPGIRPLYLGSGSEYLEELHLLGNPLLQQPRVYSGERLHEIEFKVGEPIPPGAECDGDRVNAIFFEVCLKSTHGIEMNSDSYPGNSGSPVLNDQGEVVGVLFAGLQGFKSGIFLDVQYVYELIEDL